MKKVLIIGFWSALLGFIAITAFSYFSIARLSQNLHLRNSSFSAIDGLETLHMHLVDAESARNDYVLTGDTYSQNVYVNLSNMITAEMEGFKVLFSKKDLQSERYKELAPLVKRRIANLNQSMQLRTKNKLDMRTQSMLAASGKTVQREINELILSMTREEKFRLRRLSALSDTIARKTIVAMIAGTLVSLAILSLVFYLLTKEITERKRIERRLRESEEEYRELVQGANSVILRTDREGRIIFMNRFGQGFFGYSKEEIHGKNMIGTLIPEQDSAGKDMRELFHDILSVPELHVVSESEGVRKNGEKVWISWTNKVVYSSGGGIESLLLIGNDITERKTIERIMQDSKRFSDALNRINAVIHSSLDFNTIMSRVVVEAARAAGVEAASIGLIENGSFIVKYLHNLPQELLGKAFTIRETLAVDRVAETHTPLVCNDAEYSDCANPEFVKKYHVRSFMVVPLIIRQELIGAIVFYYLSKKVELSELQVDFAYKLSSSLSLALENSRLYSSMQHELSKTALLRDVASISASSLSIQEVCERVLDTAHRYLNAAFGTIYYLSEKEKVLKNLAGFGFTKMYFKGEKEIPVDSDSAFAQVIREKLPLLTHKDFQESYCIDPYMEEKECRWIILPIAAKGRTAGTFSVGLEGIHPFREDEISLFRSIAEQLGIAIENARLFNAEVEAQQQAQYELEISNYLLKAADTLAASADLRELLSSLSEIIIEVTRRNRLGIVLVDKEKQELTLKAAYGPVPLRVGTAVRLDQIAEDFRKMILDQGMIAVDFESPGFREEIRRYTAAHAYRFALFVPLGDQVVGYIIIDEPGERRVFTAREIRIIQGIASYAAVAIHKAQLYEEQTLAERKFEQLSRQSKLILESAGEGIFGVDMEGRFTFVNQAAAHALGYTPEELVGDKCHAAIHATTKEGAPYPLEECAIFKTLIEGVGQTSSEDVFWGKNGRSFPVEYTSTPIYESGKLTGAVITFRDVTERRKTEERLKQANINYLNYVNELEQRNKEIELLSEMGGLLQACVRLDEAYSVISRFVRQIFSQEPGALYILNPAKNLFESIATWGDVISQDEQIINPNECWAIRLGRVYVVDSPEADMVCLHVKHKLKGPFLCVPMVAQGEILGLLHIEFSPKVHDLSPEAAERHKRNKQQLATAVAEDIALSLANFKLREKLYEQSIRDPLTGLFNRRYMEELLDKELHRMARKERPLGLVMIDIDHFKTFNDTYGHEAGDLILAEMGSFLQRNIREGDYACRYGGEEFVIILPETYLEHAVERAEQLRKKVKSLLIRYQGKELRHVTFSMGVVIFPNHGFTADELVRAADEALYRAKAEGRDRVVSL